MNDQPYYFEIIPRTIISKSSQKEQGQFKFHMYKTTQQVDFTREGLKAQFNQRRMEVKNVKLNFFLPNYIAGKNTNAKFILQLSKKPKHNQERQVGSYSIDSNIYIEQFKRTQQNHFAQLWELSEIYSIEVEIFFEESRYLLEKLLKEYKESHAGRFNRALVSKVLLMEKKKEVEENEEYDNEQKYKEKRLELLNKYSGAIVGHGGYKIFSEEQEKRLQKKASQSKKPINSSVIKQMKMAQSIDQKPKIKRTQSVTVGRPLHQEQFSQNQIKNIKYLILFVVILLLTGTAYFASKIFLKDKTSSYLKSSGNSQDDQNYKQSKKVPDQKQKKQKPKKSKKTKTIEQL